VTVGAYLIDIERIEETTGTYTVAAYLELEWRDPRLAREVASGLDRSRLTLQEIWWPNIELYNQYDPRNTANLHLSIKDDGTVVYEERFRARLGSDLNFRFFPFDSQDLPLQIESFRYDASQVSLVSRPGRQLKSPSAFLPDWFIGTVSERLGVDKNNPEERPYAHYVLTTRVERKWISYLWNVFLPLGLITALSWVAFWIRNKDMSNISITTLVAAVAFTFVVSGGRPRLSYMTFMDSIFLSSYLIIFLANVAAVAVHYFDGGNPGKARLLALRSRWLFPLLYLALLGLSLGSFLLRQK
jgi:hypothetical protein